MGVGAPSGTVTFLFTDIEGSTRLWQEAPTAMREALERHDSILRAAIDGHRGYVFSTGGDGFGVAFARSGDALAAAADAQAALGAEGWPEGAAIRVRMGVHTGEAEERDGDYFGTVVNRAARLMAAGHGGQVLVSAATAGVVDAGELMDLGVHRLKDLSAPQQVFQLGEGRFPALRSVDAVPGNLPTMLTELVGRAEDVAELVGLVERERLVTLTGVGGVGKTSLALAVAGASTGSFPDGCWFADLAPLTTPDEVARTLSGALGTSATDLAGLVRFVAERQVLIVLDNCEHVLSAAARLVETVLSAGSDVTIVATSREPLGVRGEAVRGVRSLTVPDPATSAADALDASAVSLFVTRATSASGRFALDDSNVEAVVEICRQLDGIPLALELAAARVRGMGPAEIARRLNERFRLLTTGGGALERHRTLQAAVAWSHELLSDVERMVFRRLAVFPASFDLAAAEAVAGGDDSLDIVDCVLRLVDRSLVGYDPTTDRYRLLETLRQYAAERLADAAERVMAMNRLALWALAIAAETFCGDLYPSAVSMEQLESEMENLRAATGWLADQDRWYELLVLWRNLFRFIEDRLPAEGYGWYRGALDHLGDLDVQERIDALGDLDVLRMWSGASADDGLAGAGIVLADETGLVHSARAWVCRAIVANRSGDPAQSKLAGERALSVADQRDEPLAALAALAMMANVHAILGDTERSEQLAAEALRRARLIGDPHGLDMALNLAAACYIVSRAEPDFEGGLRILAASPVDPGSVTGGHAVNLHRVWGLAHLGVGHAELAVADFARMFRCADQFGQESLLGDAAVGLAGALSDAGRQPLAAQILGYSETHFVSPTMRDNRHIWIHAWLASLEETLGAPEWRALRQSGARLDRRGFMRLLAESEQHSDTPQANQDA